MLYIFLENLLYIYIYIYNIKLGSLSRTNDECENVGEREREFPSVTFIEEPFLGPGCLLNLTSPFSQKQKTKKKLDFSKTD